MNETLNVSENSEQSGDDLINLNIHEFMFFYIIFSQMHATQLVKLTIICINFSSSSKKEKI